MGDAQCSHPSESLRFSYRIWAVGLLTDWRYWLLGFVTSALVGILSGPGGLGWWANLPFGIFGLYPALTYARIRRCDACGKLVRFSLFKPAPPPSPAQ